MEIPTDGCSCGLADLPDVRFCVFHHVYWIGAKRLESVSHVINTVMPKDFSAIDPAVLEHARERGKRVDAYLSQYINTGSITVEPGEWEDVTERLDIVVDWFDANVAGVEEVICQPIIHSVYDGIAGAPDFIIGKRKVLDLKCTYSPDHTWMLQLGAALDYGALEEAEILHVSPKVYKKTGCKVLRYDTEALIQYWRRCVQWLRAMRQIEAGEGRLAH